MRRKVLTVLIVGIFCTLMGCGTGKNTKANTYQKITQEKAKERMDSGDEITIIDVRTKEEYESGHIKNAILIPNETIGTEKRNELPDMDAEILVYCRSGNRSKQAASKLAKIGYTNIYEFGGVNTWTYGLEGENP